MSVNTPTSEWRLSSEGGVPVKVVERSGGFEGEDATAQEVFIIRACDLAAFVTESFPIPYSVLGTVYYPPRRRMTSLPSLTTKRITWTSLVDGLPVDPFGNDPTAPDGTYVEYLRVTIEYGPSAGNDEEMDPNDPMTYLEVSADAGGEFLVTPVGGGMKWDDNVEIKRDDVPNTTTVSTVEWTVRWPQIPYTFLTGVLMARLRSNQGKVNSSAMPLFNDAPADTILFVGYSRQDQYTWRDGLSGQSPVGLELKFIEKNFESSLPTSGGRVTHQHTFRSGSAATADAAAVEAGWHRLLSNGKRLFARVDLNKIFKA